MWPTDAPPTAPTGLVSSALSLTGGTLNIESKGRRLSGDTAGRVWVATQLVSGGSGSDLGGFGRALTRLDPARLIVVAHLTLTEG